jgi:glutathione S-transferase
MTQEIIFHHYWSSPFSEKVRVIFGMKGLAWRSVEIPNMMPKPDLTPLTGGYRKTPVLQFGADIYCDTQLIIRELERRYPERPVVNQGGMSYAAGFWSDRAFFAAAIPVIFGTLGQALPEDFKKDRAKMNPDRPVNFEQMKAAAPMFRDQCRAHFGLIDEALIGGRAFLTGNEPSAADAHAYYNIWFLKNTLNDFADSMLKEFPKVAAWFERVKAIGHGKFKPMDSKEALAIAKTSTHSAKAAPDPHDPNGRKPGDRVSVMPDDYGRDPVVGELVFSNAQEIAILRSDPAIGEVVVHFPRAGFLTMPV